MSMCLGKQKYASREAAKKTAHTAEKYRSRELRAYECPKCFSWHLTSTRTKEVGYA